ncbi:MAG: tetratricopeptide repeat protein [Myxococcota bacterium]|jgi:tetratricopeptide (TPR) repeat protein|nr:tetratricopeptide repeat protein [Myxococcota bacterium]
MPIALTALVVSLGGLIVGCRSADPMEEIEKLQAEGRLQATVEPLRELIQENPGDGHLMFVYGRTLSALGRAGLAEWSLREAMKDPDWRVSAGLQLATNAARGFNFPAAIESATTVLEYVPDNIDALLIRASAYTHSRIYHEEALADVERILELDPDNIKVMEPKILALIGLERVEELEQAMEEFGRKIDKADLGEGMSSWHCTTLSIFTWEKGDIEAARQRWADCLDAYPTDPEVVTKSLNFYDSQHHYQRSTDVLAKALELAPDTRVFRVGLSGRLVGFARYEEAEQVLLDGTKLERPRVKSAAWLDLAKFYQRRERFQDAADAVGKAVEIVEQMSNPEPRLLLDYADALLIAGEHERALAIAEEMTYQPYQEMIRARVAQERGEFEKALEHYDAGFLLWPDNPFARFYAARAAEAVGDFDRAVEEYRYSLRIAPGATDARERVAGIHFDQRHHAEALQLLRIRADSEPLSQEGELLSLRLWALAGRGWEVDRSVNSIRTGSPELLGQALAAAAQGVNDRAGPKHALALIRRAEDFDPADLNHAAALRAIVGYSLAVGELAVGEEVEAASKDLEVALAANPDAPEIREVAAYFAELSKRPSDEVIAAYNAVLEVDPENARALEGLGRAAVAGNALDDALAYFDRAAAASPDEVEPVVEAARILVRLERLEDAAQRLTEVMTENQHDAAVCQLLGEVLAERDASADRVLDLARRAVRFGGGEGAVKLLVRVHEARGEAEAARSVSERWQAFKQRESG